MAGVFRHTYRQPGAPQSPSLGAFSKQQAVVPPAPTPPVTRDQVETLFVTSYNGKVITAVRQRKYDFSKARAGRGLGYDAVRTLVNKDKGRAKKIREALLKGYSIGQAKRRAAAA